MRIVTSLLVSILLISSVSAQTPPAHATLRVTVTDPRGAAVMDARIRVQTSAGQDVTVQSDARGEATLNRLGSGNYEIRVEADGFEPRHLKDARLKSGINRIEIQLQVAGVREELEIKQDERERSSDPRGNSFSTVLTADQIENLPDDPEELEAAIRNIAGPGAVLRVNGFRGGKLPPKSQIREIRFRMNPYAAESHDASPVMVDIITKPGIDTWHGSFNFGFRDEALNARNTLAPVLGAEQFRRYGMSLDGPLWKNHTSFFMGVDGTSSFDSRTIVAALPDGPFNDVIRRPSHSLNLSSRFEHAWDKTHTLRGEYQRNANRLDNLGVGDFDLAERAFFTDRTEHILRLSDSGLLGKRLVNEARFQFTWQSVESRSSTDLPAIMVLNAFNRGGAGIDTDRRVRLLEFADNVDFSLEKHSMRAGILLEAASVTSRELRNGNGTFVFASLEDFVEGRPTTFSRRSGDPLVEFSHYEFGWYLQDDFRVRKDLTLSFGVRYEVQTNLGDKNNFAPRFGFTWSPFKDGRTTFRGGAGIFYDWFSSENFEQTLRVDGVRQTDLVVIDPCFPDPESCGTQMTLPPGRLQRDTRLRMPYIEQYSVGIQRQLGAFGQLMTNYVHQRGHNQFRGRNINAPLNGNRPDEASGNIIQVESTAKSTLNMFNVQLQLTNPQRRLFAVLGYTLSSLTNESDGAFSLPANNFDLSLERGPGAGDVRHRVFGVVNMTLFGSLRLGTTFNASSAPPYNITTGFDDNGDSVSNDRPAGVTRNSARGAAMFNLGARLSWGFGWGEPRAATGEQRAVVIRARDASDALSQMPGGVMGKRWRTEFYIQAFNVTNHANEVNFSGVQTSPFFGRATSAMPARRIETGMRFSF